MGKLKNIVLGSASESRASVLKNAGLNFEIDPADIDEDEIKSKCLKEGMSATTLAAKLAETKPWRCQVDGRTLSLLAEIKFWCLTGSYLTSHYHWLKLQLIYSVSEGILIIW